MRGFPLVILLTLVGCGEGPCPEGQGRSNTGACVALVVPAQPLEDFDPFQKPAPTKAEYVESEGVVFSSETVDEMNAQAEADYQRRRAERLADARADRIVEAQRETQREVQDLRKDVRARH